MFAAHLLDTTPFEWGDPSTWADVVNGRSSILFATLAGVSLALMSGGPSPVAGERTGVVRGRVAVRAACIWVVGILLMALGTPVYVILPAYALLFLLALPALRLRAGALFAVAAAVAATGPFLVWLVDRTEVWATPTGAILEQVTGWHYPFVLWFAFVAAGMGVGRLRLAGAPGMATAGALVCFGSALALLGYGVIGTAQSLAPADTVWSFVLSSEARSSGMAEAVGSGGVAIAVIGACVLLCATPLRWLVWPLRAVGSMPLTAYAAQLVAWALLQPEPTVLQLGSDLTAFRALDPFWPLTLATIAACTLWAVLVGRGPLEAGIGWLARRVVPAR